MNRFLQRIVDRRVAVLVAIALFTVFLAWQAAHIQMDADVLNFYPDEDPDVRFFKETGGKFGSNYINFVAMEGQDIFTEKALTQLRALTRELSKVNGVRQVLSLTNVLDMQQTGTALEVSTLIPQDYIPEDSAELTRLRKYTLENPLLVGGLISADGTCALVSVRIEENADKERVARDIRTVARSQVTDYTIYFGGFTMVMEFMGTLIGKDMARLIPITFLVVLLFLYVGTGTLRGVLLPMGTVILSIVWTLGVMTTFGIALSILTSAVPVVLIAVGTSSGIYLIVRNFEDHTIADAPSRAKTTLAAVSVPIAVSGTAMFFGFGSLATAPLDILKEFGLATGLGALVSTLLSMTFIPSMLALLPDRAPRKISLASSENMFIDRLLRGWGRLATRYSTAVFAIFIFAVLVAFWLYPKVPRNINLLDYFPAGSEPQTSEYILKKNFGGSQLFIVNFHGDDVRDPAILDQMDMLSKRLRVIPDVNLPQSLVDILSSLNWELNQEPGIPDSADKITNLWLLLDGQSSLEMFIEKNFANGVVQARIGDIDTAVVHRALEAIEETLEETLQSDLVDVNITELTGPELDAVLQFVAKRTAEKIALDYQFHTKRETPVEPIAQTLRKILSDQPTIEDTDRAALQSKLTDYMESEASDIELGNDGLASQIAQALSKLTAYDKSTITQALKNALPEQILAEDPGALPYFADSVFTHVAQFLERKRFAQAQKNVFALLNIDPALSKNRQLIQDVKATLWAVNHHHVALPAENYTKIFGKDQKGVEHIRFTARLTGWPPLSAKFDKMLVGTQIKSILLAIFTILALLTLFYRSPFGGVIATAPICFTVLMNFAAMAVFRIPLDNATIMISSIAMGIGVGYAIHFLDRVSHELRKGAPMEEAISIALTTKGRAIIINTLAVALGFAVLYFSVMTPQKRFGMLIAFTMFVAAFGTFSLLPALVSRFQPRFLLHPPDEKRE